MAKEKAHALYLQSNDGEIQLVHPDNLEAMRAEGWSEPEGRKSNGEEWNREDDFPGQDAAAELEKKAAEARAKKDAESAKAQADAEKVAKK